MSTEVDTEKLRRKCHTAFGRGCPNTAIRVPADDLYALLNTIDSLRVELESSKHLHSESQDFHAAAMVAIGDALGIDVRDEPRCKWVSLEASRVVSERDRLKQQLREAEARAVPEIPTEAMWGGMARDAMMWLSFNRPTAGALLKHFEMLGHEIPQWLRDEPEMQSADHVPSKGTRAVIIWRLMYEAALLTPKPREPQAGEEG